MEKDVVRVLIGLLIVCVLAMLGIVYLLSGLNGSLQYPEISISDSYIVDPSRAVAAFLIPISTYILVLIVVARLIRIYSFVFRTGDMWLFSFIIVCLIVGFVGLMGVAAVPIEVERSLHLTAAIALFLGLGFMLIGFTVLDESIDLEASRSVRLYRLGFSIILLSLGIALAVTADVSDAATGILEIVLILSGLLYILSWSVSSEFPIKSRTLPARVSVIESERANPPVELLY